MGYLGGRLFSGRARRLSQADLGQADRRSSTPRSAVLERALRPPAIAERDWPKIGKDLEGKINIYVGDMDNYYLNNAVYLMEDFLKKTTNPPYGGEVLYGDRAEHCWNGTPKSPTQSAGLRYHQMYAPKIVGAC